MSNRKARKNSPLDANVGVLKTYELSQFFVVERNRVDNAT